MAEKQIIIRIGGLAASGKTTISKIITDALEAHGIQVTNTDVDLNGGSMLPENWFERNLEHIGNAKVRIETVQTRPIITNLPENSVVLHEEWFSPN